MIMLDSMIRSLSLTMVDADDPRTSLFPRGSVPMVDPPLRPPPQHLQPTAWFPDPSQSITGEQHGCSCNSMTLNEHWPSVNDLAPMWGSTPAWNESWSEAEIRKESCRRLCWSSMCLAAGHISYTTAQRSQGLDLFISDPSNVR